jgi:hypothetical protein
MTSKRYTGGAGKFGSLLFTNLGQKRTSVRLKEFTKPDWSLSSDPLNQIVCSSKHSILMVFRNLLEVLQLCIGNALHSTSGSSTWAVGSQLL